MLVQAFGVNAASSGFSVYTAEEGFSCRDQYGCIPLWQSRRRRAPRHAAALSAAYGGAGLFRHSFTTLGQRNNISSKNMQVIDGWSDAKTLNKMYTHIQEEDIEIACQQMAQMYAS